MRGCELVLGGLLRVKLMGKPELNGDTAEMKLRCVADKSCKSKVKLRHGGKTIGKKRRSSSPRERRETVLVKLNQRGRRSGRG